MKVKRNLRIKYALMLLLIMIWGSLAAVSKLLLQGLDSFQLQFFMYLFAGVMMTVALVLTGRIRVILRLSAREVARQALLLLPAYYYYFAYMLSMKLIPASETSMINYLFPLMIIILAIPINKERLSSRKALSTILGFIGVLIIISKGNLSKITLSNLPGDLLALAAAVLWGLFSNLGKKNGGDPLVSTYLFIMGSLVLSFGNMLLFSKFTWPSALTLTGAAWVGCVNITAAQFLYLNILKELPTHTVANMSYITPFVSLLFIWVLLKEQIVWIQIVGLCVILISVGLVRLNNGIAKDKVI